MGRPRRSRASRRVAFAALAFATALSLLAGAQTRKPAGKPAPAAKAPPTKPQPEAGTLATREERPTPAAPASRDAGASGGAVLEARTVGDGGRVFRFGEVEVEGRLKSPQIVYFLRRVRAEFAAGDLGHRSFLREMSETKNEPGF